MAKNEISVIATTRLFFRDKELFVEKGESVSVSPEKAKELADLKLIEFPANNPVKPEQTKE